MALEDRKRNITTLNYVTQIPQDAYNDFFDIALEYDKRFKHIYRDGGKLVYYIDNNGIGEAEVGFLTMLVNIANENLTLNNHPGKLDLNLLLQDAVQVDGREYVTITLMTHYILHTQMYAYLAGLNKN